MWVSLLTSGGGRGGGELNCVRVFLGGGWYPLDIRWCEGVREGGREGKGGAELCACWGGGGGIILT